MPVQPCAYVWLVWVWQQLGGCTSALLLACELACDEGVYCVVCMVWL